MARVHRGLGSCLRRITGNFSWKAFRPRRQQAVISNRSLMWHRLVTGDSSCTVLVEVTGAPVTVRKHETQEARSTEYFLQERRQYPRDETLTSTGVCSFHVQRELLAGYYARRWGHWLSEGCYDEGRS